MVWLILGIVLLVAAAILYAVSQSSKRESLALATTDLTTVADLRTLYDKVSAEVGKGAFAQRVALQGTIECEAPLQAAVSNTPCAAFRHRVERRYEEEYEENDSNGNPVRRWREQTETVASNDRQAQFAVRDATGSIPVAPEGAHLEMETSVDRFEQAAPGTGGGGLLQFGAFQLDLGGMGGGQRTLGYHVHEEILPLGRTAFVMGTASDAGGNLTIGKSSQRHEPFRVSLHNREQLLQSARNTAKYTMYAAMGCGALGVLLVIIGLLTRR